MNEFRVFISCFACLLMFVSFVSANSGALYTLVALTGTVLSLAAVCATILHILKGKRRSTGKQKELQRPFIKRNLASPSGTRQTPPPFRAVSMIFYGRSPFFSLEVNCETDKRIFRRFLSSIMLISLSPGSFQACCNYHIMEY